MTLFHTKQISPQPPQYWTWMRSLLPTIVDYRSAKTTSGLSELLERRFCLSMFSVEELQFLAKWPNQYPSTSTNTTCTWYVPVVVSMVNGHTRSSAWYATAPGTGSTALGNWKIRHLWKSSETNSPVLISYIIQSYPSLIPLPHLPHVVELCPRHS